MGIGGHMLGDKKLNQLRNRTGINFRRAYRRGATGEACYLVGDSGCVHYRLIYQPTPKHSPPVITLWGPIRDIRWSSCPERKRR